MIRQTVLPFKLEKTNDLVTPCAGPALWGEFAIGLDLLKSRIDICRNPVAAQAMPPASICSR